MIMPSTAQAIRDAIAAELAAARFYDDLAARTDDARARQFLERMAEVEHVHGSEIAASGRRLVPEGLPDFPSEDAETIEVLPEWQEADGVTIDEALEIAAACERKAGSVYRSWAERMTGSVRAFFLLLTDAEAEHERMIDQVLCQRVAVRRSSMPIGQIARNIVDGERTCARMFANMAQRSGNAQVQRFLMGMADVQELTAAETERKVVELTGAPIATKPNLPMRRFQTIPRQPLEEALDLGQAMRLGADVELRAALVYGSMSRYVGGAEAALVAGIAEAETARARRIEAAMQEV
jgi:rubrerythrin